MHPEAEQTVDAWSSETGISFTRFLIYHASQSCADTILVHRSVWGFLATDGRSANSFHLTLVQLRQSLTMKQQQCRMTVELHIKRDSLNDMAISRRVRLFAPSFSAHLLLAQLEKPKPDHVQTEDLVVSRCSCSSTATRDRCRAR